MIRMIMHEHDKVGTPLPDIFATSVKHVNANRHIRTALCMELFRGELIPREHGTQGRCISPLDGTRIK